jgi:type VI secretion system protein ImpC
VAQFSIRGARVPGRATIGIELASGAPRATGAARATTGILLLGDFSGGAGPAAPDVERLRSRRVSVDNFDTILRELRPTVSYAIEGPIEIRDTLTLQSLDDFHPDGLFAGLAALQACAGIRKRLEQPQSAEQALHDLAALGAAANGAAPTGSKAEPRATPAESAESSSDLLQRLIGGRPAGAGRASRVVDELIKSAFAGVDDRPATPGLGAARERLTEIMTGAMRAALNDPSFKALEAAWRGVHWLVSRLEDDQARIAIADISQAALVDMLERPAEELERTPLHRLLREQPPGLIVGLYTFRRELDDLLLLGKLGAVAARADALFLAHGSLALCGCDSPRDADAPRQWALPDDQTAKFQAELRAHPVTRSVCLATPRFLLRHPYGARTDPIESFAFEELPVAPEPERFLWGNPALLAAFALAADDASSVVAGSPMPTYHDGSGLAQRLPLEVSLGEQSAARAAQCGLSPLRCNRATGEITPHIVALAQTA